MSKGYSEESVLGGGRRCLGSLHRFRRLRRRWRLEPKTNYAGTSLGAVQQFSDANI